MISLSENLKRRMKENRLTVPALSSLSGVKMSAIHNIRCGRISNPTLHILQGLSNALGCTMDEFVNEDKIQFHNVKDLDGSLKMNLFVNTLILISELLKNENNIKLERTQIYEVIEEIYTYSVRNQSFNIIFAQYIFANNLKKPAPYKKAKIIKNIQYI